MPAADDANEIAEALITIGSQYLNLHNEDLVHNEKVHHYIDEITMCEALYLSIIDE
jgi:hypothetical protein